MFAVVVVAVSLTSFQQHFATFSLCVLQLEVLKDSHVYSIAKEHAISSFVFSDIDRTLVIYIAWGMLETDMSDCHFSTPECLGKARWDSTFNPSTPAAQQAMLVSRSCVQLLGSIVNILQQQHDHYHIYYYL